MKTLTVTIEPEELKHQLKQNGYLNTIKNIGRTIKGEFESGDYLGIHIEPEESRNILHNHGFKAQDLFK